MSKPKIYLIPSLMGDSAVGRVLPSYNLNIINQLNHYVVENEKSARRFIKKVAPDKSQSDLQITLLNKHTENTEIPDLLLPLKAGHSIGIISEAGMPGIADPGARMVWAAHQNGFEVIPLIGPSSIFLALAASGFNGQSFSFHGYLPIDNRERKNALKRLEQKSLKEGSAEIFMETPYRNNKFLEAIVNSLSNATKLCVACDISLASEFIYSGTIQQWKSKKVDLHKRPAIFVLQA